MLSSVCHVGQQVHNNGRALSFLPNSDYSNFVTMATFNSIDLVNKGFYLTFEHGEPCSEIQPNYHRKTTIQVICDVNGATNPSPAPFMNELTLCDGCYGYQYHN